MVTGVPQEERALIEAVEHRLAQRYAQLPHGHVAGVVQHVYASFNQSKLRNYVPLLVERRAGEELAMSTTCRKPPVIADRVVANANVGDVVRWASQDVARQQTPA